MTENERIARFIVSEVEKYSLSRISEINPEMPDPNTYLMDLIIDALDQKDRKK